MKLLVLLAVAMGITGFIFEWIFRIMYENISLTEKFKKLKMLFMIPVYSVGCLLIKGLYLIPFMQDIKFLALLMLFGGILATATEYGFGYLFNIKLKLDLWDYSWNKIKLFGKTIPLNFKGQIDLQHFFLWCGLTLPTIYVVEIIQWLAK